MVHIIRVLAIAILHQVALIGVIVLGFGLCFRAGPALTCRILDASLYGLSFPFWSILEGVEGWSPLLFVPSVVWSAFGYAIWVWWYRRRHPNGIR